MRGRRLEQRPACGTYSAAHYHRTHGEELDDVCREARNQYDRNRRALRRTRREVEQRATAEALGRLAKEFPDRFEQLLSEERRRQWAERAS